MLAMDKVYFIRRLYYEQGMSIADIITEAGHDRKTIGLQCTGSLLRHHIIKVPLGKSGHLILYQMLYFFNT